MKKIAFFVCTLVASLTAQAQSELYNKMSQVSGVESFYYTQDMIRNTDWKSIDNPDINLSSLFWGRVNSLEYLSATKGRAIRKLRKAQEERLEEEQKDSWKESQSAQGIVRKKILGSDNKVLMQINKGDRKISVYKKGSRDYTLVYDNKDRYTLIRMQADIPQYQLKEIFIQ